MAEPLKLIAPRVAFVDVNRVLTRDGFLFLAGVFQRIGGATAPSSDDTALGGQNPLDFSGSDPMMTKITISDVVAEVRALQDQLSEITKRLEGMQQGQLAI